MRPASPSAPPIPDRRENLTGLVERVIFHNDDTGFCVLRVKSRGRRQPITLVGHAATIGAGESIQAAGRWVNDRTHGLQFQADVLRATPPTSAEGIRKYLASGLIRGIGPTFAGKLVRAFGTQVFDIIEQTPHRLQEINGIGAGRAASLVAAWAEQKAIRDIMIFLHGHGVGTARAVRIFRTYGAEAIGLITENPYRLARDIRGIGFKSADQIASRLGIAQTAMIRVRAGISHALATAMDDGHCGLPLSRLRPATADLLDVPADLIETALAAELNDGAVIADTVAGEPCLFLAGLYRAERAIAARLRMLRRGAPPWPAIDAAKAIPSLETTARIRLADSQKAALRLALACKVLVITGGPGVGKTTLVNAILKILEAKAVRIALAAPTGRAARRLADSTGLPAKTLHRLLEADPMHGGFRRNASNRLACDLLVVDETSMIDVPLMHALLKAVPDHAALILVGDVDQLPSVGPGQVLADLIAAAAVPVARLTEVFRQAAESRIIVTAHHINQGRMPEGEQDPASDFHIVECGDPEAATARILRIVGERIPARYGLDPIRDVQVLCPMHRGRLGARSLNAALQQALNPPGPLHVARFGSVYGIGDKVMQIENDYEKDVYNGDLGIVRTLDPDAAELVIEVDGRPVTYRFDDLDRIALAYATTIHKSQGSEYPAVVIPLTTQHYPMLQRKLLYTAVTRGRRLVVIVGEWKAIALAVQGVAPRRWSGLREWLRPNPAPGVFDHLGGQEWVAEEEALGSGTGFSTALEDLPGGGGCR